MTDLAKELREVAEQLEDHYDPACKPSGLCDSVSMSHLLRAMKAARNASDELDRRAALDGPAGERVPCRHCHSWFPECATCDGKTYIRTPPAVTEAMVEAADKAHRIAMSEGGDWLVAMRAALQAAQGKRTGEK